ncbi:MAG: NTP transferase domain-containing protein [Candidatus Eisenbacteria bacterium]|nr:NTP transferase domain-containing protein [Candidatus Eisenbacteria bacterium]
MTTSTSSRGALILAGGRGERFWPWSTPERPKQLLPLASGGRTLLAATFQRALQLMPAERIVIMTNAALVAACERECPGAIVVGEPMGRNTAPAIAAAAAFFGDSDAFAVLPSDHAIDDEAAFVADFDRAFTLAAREPLLVTFGIKPTSPETSFGYIQRGAALSDRVHRVARFTEKPDLARAQEYVAGGQHAWNSGMFVWGKRTFMQALSVGRPAVAEAFAGMSFRRGDERAFEAAIGQVFSTVESVSVDYAVLEVAPNVVTIEAAFDWDDLGSWSAWARRQPVDARGNVTWGDAVPVDCERCVIVGDGAPTAPMGLQDMVVVTTPQGTLVCRREDSEQVRRVTEAVRARKGRP